jgi:hypothetical protein
MELRSWSAAAAISVISNLFSEGLPAGRMTSQTGRAGNNVRKRPDGARPINLALVMILHKIV